MTNHHKSTENQEPFHVILEDCDTPHNTGHTLDGLPQGPPESTQEQYLSLQDRMNALADDQDGGKTVQRGVIIKKKFKRLRSPSLRNAFGLLSRFGLGKYEVYERQQHATKTERAPRVGREGEHEIYANLEHHVRLYRELSKELETLTFKELRPRIIDADSTRQVYLQKAHEAAVAADEHQRLHQMAVQKLYAERKTAREIQPQDNAYVSTLKKLDVLEITEQKHRHSHTKKRQESAAMQNHAAFLGYTTKGLYTIFQSTLKASEVTRTWSNQLADIKKFSSVSSETLSRLVEIDAHIRQSRPYIIQAQHLLGQLGRVSYGCDTAMGYHADQSIQPLEQQIAQFQHDSDAHYDTAQSLLDELERTTLSEVSK